MFYFQSRSEEIFVYQRVCEEYLYTSVVEEAVYRAPIQIVQTTDRQTDRQMQQCSNSATVLSTVG